MATAIGSQHQDSFYEKADVSLKPSDIEDDDEVHAGLTFPTEEEIATLKRVSDAIPWNAYLIAVVELAERFSFYGSSVVFTNFIQQPLPPGSRTGAGFRNGQAGALGLGQRASTGLTTFYQFWCYITPILGAYIADTYLGRYNTICIAVVVALLGHIIMIISAVPGVIDHPHHAAAAFALSLIVTGLGTGLFKSNISPLVAEQYRRKKLFIAIKNGERVIVDPIITVSRLYMYFYLFINIGALAGQIAMTYAEKYVGFWLAYTLPTIMFLLCPIILIIGRNRYSHTPPTGSILPTFLRLIGFASRGKWSLNPVRLYYNFSSPDFWENAKPSKQAVKPAWMTFDDEWVDQVARGFSACLVFCWFPLYWLTYNQLNNNLTSQAATMVTNGLPNDILSNLDPFTLIIFIPICDLVIYPFLRRIGINFSPIKKIAWGFETGAFSMIWAAVVQHYVYKTNACHYHASTCVDSSGNPIVSPLNVWIQTGSYFFIAFSEILASITGLEYAFTKAPTNMRSLVMSFFLFSSAISAAIGEAFVSLSADPLLVWNYGTMGVLAGIAGLLFWIAHKHLDAREEELNHLSEGHVGGKTHGD